MTSDMEVDAMDWLGWGVFGLIATATLTAVLIGAPVAARSIRSGAPIPDKRLEETRRRGSPSRSRRRSSGRAITSPESDGQGTACAGTLTVRPASGHRRAAGARQ